MKRDLKKRRRLHLRKARTRAKLYGTHERPRLSVFRSNRFVWAQLIDDAERKTLVAASSRRIAKAKMTKTEAARMLGELLAEKAKAAGIVAALFDRGAYRYHGRVKAIAEGARKGGLTL